MENKFYKVGQSGGSYVVAYFYNPVTHEARTECVRDYDYSDCSRDNDELYYMPIDKEVSELYRKYCGIVGSGDIVRVVKGRKVPIGTIAKVVRTYDYKDRYGRVLTRYAVLDNGMKTSVDNCEIIE